MTTVRATAHRETQYGPTEWLRVIHECNRVRPDMFGQPETVGVTAAGYVEEYADARVIIDLDSTGNTARDSGARIVSITDAGAAALAQAARNLGIAFTG